MTLTTENNTKEYTANGSTTEFAYDFLLLDEDDMEVYLDGVLQSSGYTVDGVGEVSGGNVTFSSAPADDVRVSLYRVVDLTQEVDYQPYDPFPADTHETALDKLTMLVQQVYERTLRAITAPIGGDSEVDYTLPQYEAGKGIMWDEASKELVNSDDDINGITTAAAASAAAAAASASAAASSETDAEAAEVAAEAAQAAAETAQTGAETAEDKADDWANEDEDVEVETGKYSSYHWTQKAEEWANEDEDVEIETGKYSSYHWTQKAEEWANEDEDVEIETGKYSAYHWAQKSEENADITGDAGEWTAAQRYTKITKSASSGTVTIDLADENAVELTISGDVTIAVSNEAWGRGCTLKLIQNATGGYVISLDTDIDAADYDFVPNPAASAVTIYWLWSDGTKTFIRKVWEDD